MNAMYTIVNDEDATSCTKTSVHDNLLWWYRKKKLDSFLFQFHIWPGTVEDSTDGYRMNKTDKTQWIMKIMIILFHLRFFALLMFVCHCDIKFLFVNLHVINKYKKMQKLSESKDGYYFS